MIHFTYFLYTCGGHASTLECLHHCLHDCLHDCLLIFSIFYFTLKIKPPHLDHINNNNKINYLRQIFIIIRALSLPNKEHVETPRFYYNIYICYIITKYTVYTDMTMMVHNRYQHQTNIELKYIFRNIKR